MPLNGAVIMPCRLQAENTVSISMCYVLLRHTFDHSIVYFLISLCTIYAVRVSLHDAQLGRVTVRTHVSFWHLGKVIDWCPGINDI